MADATPQECECHEWTGEEPHRAEGRWWADTGMGGTWLVCDAVKRACEAEAAADPAIDPATFTPVETLAR